jgi:putative two-component system response regulator
MEGIMENERKRIFLVDDNGTHLTAGKEILKKMYKVYPIPSARIMFALFVDIIPDMILLDIEMPEMNGYETIKKLKVDPRWWDIPVIFLSARTDTGSELEGLNLGAIDYVAKPFSAPLLLKRIENHLFAEWQKRQLKEMSDILGKIRQKTMQIVNLQNAVLGTVRNLVEFRDNVTEGRVRRTQNYLKLLVDDILEEEIYTEETSTWNMDYLIPSAQLYDVGKIAISDNILNKPGKLSCEEFEIMKTHAAIGAEIIQKSDESDEEHDFMRHARLIAGGHHERWDGTGYPLGVKGKEIPLEARLMSIVDVYDALTSVRPYKQPLSSGEAKEIIWDGKGTQFDPVLVDEFLKVMA